MTVAIEPLPERIRCTACSAEIASRVSAGTLSVLGWRLLEGFWFCVVHAAAAPWIVALDKEQNAHQVTMLRLEQAVEDLGHATIAEGDWLSKASRRMCETVLGERDALRTKVREQAAEIDSLKRDASKWYRAAFDGVDDALEHGAREVRALERQRAADLEEAVITYEAMRAEIDLVSRR